MGLTVQKSDNLKFAAELDYAASGNKAADLVQQPSGDGEWPCRSVPLAHGWHASFAVRRGLTGTPPASSVDGLRPFSEGVEQPELWPTVASHHEVLLRDTNAAWIPQPAASGPLILHMNSGSDTPTLTATDDITWFPSETPPASACIVAARKLHQEETMGDAKCNDEASKDNCAGLTWMSEEDIECPHDLQVSGEVHEEATCGGASDSICQRNSTSNVLQSEAIQHERKAILAAFPKEHGYLGVNLPRRTLRKTKYASLSAAKRGDHRIVQLLIEEGADPLQTTSQGRTAAQIARAMDRNGSHSAVLQALGGP